MMRRLYYILFAFVLCAAASCSAAQDEFQKESIGIRVRVVDASSETKSTHLKADAEVRNLAVALYADGMLYGSRYFSELSEMSMGDIRLGKKYRVYALANRGKVTFPSDEADLASMTIDWNDVREISAWPMAYSADFIARQGACLDIALVRLVARCDLNIDVSALSVHSFLLKKAVLKSGAGDCSPFLDRSVPVSSTVDPDYATSFDLLELREGGAVSFFLFESCFGDLLPGNNDAWNKVPSNIPADVEPPYFELEGTLTINDNSYSTRDVKYRFYLGRNATSNFDVVRNTVNKVTLTLTDNNVNRGSWKIETGAFNDKASLSFRPAVREIPYLSSADVVLDVSPAGLKFRIYEKDGSMSDAGLAYEVNGSRVTITSTREGFVSGTLYASTIDGRKECSCEIRTVEPPVTLQQIRLRCIYYDDYYEPEGVYRQMEGMWFSFEADLVYSDGTEVNNVKDMSIFEWYSADPDIVGIFFGNPEKLFCYSVGETGVCAKLDGVMSNMVMLSVYSPYLSVRSNPRTISPGRSSTLMAFCGGRNVSTFTTWKIVSGAEYGYISGSYGKYSSFVPNGGNSTAVDVVIEGSYDGMTDECTIHVEPALPPGPDAPAAPGICL